MFHSDRLACSPGTAGYIYELCQKHNVKLLAKINPFTDGKAGEVMAMLAGMSKRDSVIENRPRIKAGLRARTVIKSLPVTGRVAYGYQLRYELKDGKKTPVAFEPDPTTYPVAWQIWRLASNGTPLRRICRTLVEDRIPAPRGGTAWG